MDPAAAPSASPNAPTPQETPAPGAGAVPPGAPEAKKPGAAEAVAKALSLHGRSKVRGAALAEQQQKLDAERAALAEQQQKLAQVAELGDLIGRGEVVEAAKRLAGGEEGLEKFLQQLTDSIVASGKGKPAGLSTEDKDALAKVKALEAEIAQLKKANEDREAHLKTTRQQYEAQQLEAQATQYLDAGWKALEQSKDEYELVLASDKYKARVEEHVFKGAAERAKQAKALGRQPAPLTLDDFKAAAAEVQKQLEEELTPALATRRIRSKLGITGEQQPASPVPGERTVTTDGRGDPPVSPDYERLSVSERLYRFQQGHKPRF